MAQAGIIITQPGIDVKSAADYQMLFNSNWPSLQIAFEAIVSVAAGASGQVAHNLGFYPLTMAWFSINGVSVGRFYGSTLFDKTNVYINNSTNPAITPVNIVVSIKCYNIDISKKVNYELPLPATFKMPYDSTYGMKVVKNGKAITSTDLRDFILHTRAQSPAILSIVTLGSKGGGISYTNPAGYVPWVLGFISTNVNNTQYQCFPPGGNQSTPNFVQNGSKASIAGFAGTMASIVVLRDPLVVSKTKQVIYNG